MENKCWKERERERERKRERERERDGTRASRKVDMCKWQMGDPET
jgi:hypothetical protein